MGKDKSKKDKKSDKEKSSKKNGEKSTSGKNKKVEKSDKKAKKAEESSKKAKKEMKKDNKKKVEKEDFSSEESDDESEEEQVPKKPEKKKGGKEKGKKMMSSESDEESKEDASEEEDDDGNESKEADSSEVDDASSEEVKTKKDKKEKSSSKKKNGKAEMEQLEFTKPTINQTMRDKTARKMEKKKLPLSTDATIQDREFEDFKDEVDELNSGIGMLKLSYGSVIKSLVAMFERREKKKKKKEKKKEVEPDKVNFLTNMSAVNPNVMAEKAEELEASDAEKYDLERFMNPVTREQTFQALFDEVTALNKKIEPWTKFYDSKGYFLREEFDAQREVKIKRKQFNKCWVWCRMLAKVVDDVARSYNDDLLNYFRMH